MQNYIFSNNLQNFLFFCLKKEETKVFFSSIQFDMTDFKFDRKEANKR